MTEKSAVERKSKATKDEKGERTEKNHRDLGSEVDEQGVVRSRDPGSVSTDDHALFDGKERESQVS